MPRVFIIETLKLAAHNLKTFGDPITVFPSHIRRPPIYDTQNWKAALAKELRHHKWQPKVDYIVISGSGTIMFLTGCVCEMLAREIQGAPGFYALMFKANEDSYNLLEVR